MSWDVAIADIARRLQQITTDHGGSSLASYIGNPAAFSTMHYAYGFGFTRMLGSDKAYNAMQVDTGARVLASDQVFGDGSRYPFPDLPDTDFLMIFGGNPMISKMSLICAPRALQHLDAIASRGSVIVVDPRRTETAQRYEHRPIAPDSDVWLLLGMVRCLIEEGLTQSDYLAAHVTGWDELAAALTQFDWPEISARCTIPEVRIRELARRFADARTAACYGRVGTNRGRYSTLCNVLMDAINLATGNFAKPGGSVIGQSPFEPVAGTRRPSDYGKKRSRIGDLPLVAGTQPGGGLADEILTPGEGQIRALFLDSGNPVMAYPDGDKTSAALDSLDLFVSLDLYVNESNRYADYVLPVPTFYERADVNDLWAANAPEPWVHYVDAVIPPRGECRHEYEIYDAILERMGLPDPVTAMTGQPSDDDARRRSHMELADSALRNGPMGDQFGASPDGLNLEKLRALHPSGLATQPRTDAAGSWARIAHEDGKAHLWTDVIAGEFKRLRADPFTTERGELKLFGRRLLHTMNSWLHKQRTGDQKRQPDPAHAPGGRAGPADSGWSNRSRSELQWQD